MARTRLLNVMSGAVAAVCLAGCVSVLPEPNVPTALYRIGPVAPIDASLAATVIVREPDAPRILAGEAITTSDSSGAIRLIDGVEWADAATRLLQLALLDALNGQGAGGKALSPQGGGRGAFEVSWRVVDLSVRRDIAIADLELTILNGRSRTPVAQDRAIFETRVRSGSDEDRALALVEASRGALRDAAAKIVRHTSTSE